jgi:transcriptional regulator GlxA family with amidase domain
MNLYCVQDWPERAAQAGYCVKAMAAALGVSPRTLERFFRSEFGQTPRVWVRRERMRRARALLRTGMLRVKEVAQRMGYHGAATFGRAFRRVNRCSPRRYVRQLSRRRRR